MKQQIANWVRDAVTALQNAGVLANDMPIQVQIERARDPKHGHFACNIALMLAKAAKMNPRELATQLVAKLPHSEYIANVSIAGPGFINFMLTDTALHPVITEIHQQAGNYGHSKVGAGKKVHIEYVSANPTGPLHVGHGRGAAYGACVANLLTAAGFAVHREYYVNDAGRQIHILTVSVWIRYLQQHKINIELPNKAYQGQYVIDIAKTLAQSHGQDFVYRAEQIQAKIPTGLDPEDDKETLIDAYINAATDLLGDEHFEIIRQASLQSILKDIEDDLAEFGVTYDAWFPESKLVDAGMLAKGIDLLTEHGHTYQKEGALWFRATDLGDEKDRVLVRANGQPTYFASDVAYHLHKYNKGFDIILDVFGADHHGYISRIQCFLKGLGKDPSKVNTLLVQFAILYRGKEKVSMSTRSGQFVTLRKLRHEVGNDAARYFYIMRKPEQHLDFDLELAKSQSNDNPVFYIQYAHARICRVWEQMAAQQMTADLEAGLNHLDLLNLPHEQQLLTHLNRYAETIESCALKYEPHTLAHYLQELANLFHSYYNAEKFLVENGELRNARLCLIAAIRQLLANGLGLLGLSAPQKM